MKKAITLICVIMLVLSLGITAFAADNTTKTTAGSSSTIQGKIDALKEKTAAKLAKLEQRTVISEEMKVYLEGKRAVAESNHDRNSALAEENAVLRRELAASLAAIKAGETPLDEEIAEQLKALRQELKAKTAALHEFKGDIKEIAETRKEFVKNENYEQLNIMFESIYAIQNERYALRQEINSILKEMTALIG